MLHSSIVGGSSIDPASVGSPSHDVMNNFLVPGCIYAIAANEKSTDKVWLVKIREGSKADQPYTDDYGFTVAKGKKFSVESVWNELVKQDTKDLFKK